MTTPHPTELADVSADMTLAESKLHRVASEAARWSTTPELSELVVAGEDEFLMLTHARGKLAAQQRAYVLTVINH